MVPDPPKFSLAPLCLLAAAATGVVWALGRLRPKPLEGTVRVDQPGALPRAAVLHRELDLPYVLDEL